MIINLEILIIVTVTIPGSVKAFGSSKDHLLIFQLAAAAARSIARLMLSPVVSEAST